MNTLTVSIGLRRLIGTAIYGALALSCGAVYGAESLDPGSRIVKFADLNISDPPGAAALYARIQAAAESVCSHYVFKSDEAEHGCVHDAIANAVTKVNQPALSAVY